MPNGDIDELWRALARVEVQLAALNSTVNELDKRWSALTQRQSQVPTWVWLGVTVLLTLGIWLADQVISHVP